MYRHFIVDHETRLQRLLHSPITPGALPQAGIEGAPLALGEAFLEGASLEAQTAIALTAFVDSRLRSGRSANGAFSPIAWGHRKTETLLQGAIKKTPITLPTFDLGLRSMRSANGAFSPIAWGNAPGAIHGNEAQALKARFIRTVRSDGR